MRRPTGSYELFGRGHGHLQRLDDLRHARRPKLGQGSGQVLQDPHRNLGIVEIGRTDLHGRGPGGGGAVSVNAGGEVAVIDGQTQLAGEQTDSLL